MKSNPIDSSLCGSICLLIGWGAATLLHECGHLVAAHSFGLEASLGKLTLTTGSVLISEEMNSTETAIVAVAGSLSLILIGVVLIRIKHPAARMIGIVFLCRAWIDALPLCTHDGAMMVGAVGFALPWAVVIAEILICGGMIWYALNNHPDTYQHTEEI